MTIIKYFFTLTVVLASFTLQAQQTQIVDIDLNWIGTGASATLQDGEGSVHYPGAWVYSVNFPLAGSAALNTSLEVLEETIHEGVNIRNLPTDYHVESYAYGSRGEYTAVIRIITSRSDASSFKKLEKARLTVTYDVRQNVPAPDNKRVSAFSEGDIYKLAIPSTGMYKISGAELASQFDIDISTLNPLDVQILGNPGGMVPWANAATRNDDVEPIPYKWYGTEDGVVNNQDFMIFFAEGADVWKHKFNQWEMEVNPYSDNNFVFLKINGVEDATIIERLPTGSQGEVRNTYTDRQYYGKADLNLLGRSFEHQGSGLLWLSDEFSNTRQLDLAPMFNFDQRVPGSEVRIISHVYGRSESSSNIELLADASTFNKRVSRVSLDIEAEYASRGIFNEVIQPLGNSFNLMINYPPTSAQSQGWLDFMSLEMRKNLIYQGNEIILTDTFTTDDGGFAIQNLPSNGEIWETTNYNEVKELRPERNGNLSSFSVTNPNLRTYVAFVPQEVENTPVFVEKMTNQNLHALDNIDMITIYHPVFQEEADRHATYRSQDKDFEVRTVNVFDIYNEFASGRAEPTAIRDFCKMLYQRSSRFKFLLLFGDASYDYRYIDQSVDNQNFVPTFETVESLKPIFAFPTDDFYALLDVEEGQRLGGSLDIGVGRFLCRTVDEAKLLVDKVIHYETSPKTLGDWRNRMVFMADDEDSNRHLIDVESLAREAEQNHRVYNQEKIYFDAYDQVSTAGGTRFPEATEEINKATFKGALSLTFLGHGGPTGLAQERVLQVNNILDWSNYDKMPIILTATCSFTPYDEPSITSAGEHCMLSPNGGAIAILSTVRAVYATENYQLTRGVKKFLYDDNDGNPYRLGEVMRLGKNEYGQTGQQSNDRKFGLFGDPSLKTANPRYNVITRRINDQDAVTFQDSLGALDMVSLEGDIVNFNGEVISDFNGDINVTVFDKPITLTTKGTDIGSSPLDFDLQKNTLFKGSSTVENGKWKISFILPKDLNFTYGEGKLSYYASSSDDMRDAHGYDAQIVIGGNGNVNVQDDQGPQVEVFMNDDQFKFGGITGPNPLLFVKLEDDFGINVVGNSIGHDLTAVLDNNTQNTFVLNDFYVAEKDNFRKGTVTFPLVGLEDGRHHIKVTAWDIANNFAEGFTEFVVVSDASKSIQNVLSYPNPFSDYSILGFEHNFAPGNAEIEVQIFNAAGQPVNQVKKNLDVTGYRVTDIRWDGTDYSGNKVTNGVYLYKIIMRRNVQGSEKTKESSFERIVVLK